MCIRDRFNPLPTSPSTPINVDKFEAAIAGVDKLMTKTERSLAQTVLSDLRIGANTLIDASNLERGVIPNKVMHLEAGIHCADVIASWVKKRIVAGPFSDPPATGFPFQPLVRGGKEQ